MSKNRASRAASLGQVCVSAVLAAIAIAVTGCGGNLIEGGPVAGQVTLDGKPLTGATVKFMNVDLGLGVTCHLDDEGMFASDKEVPAATYQVVIGPAPSNHQPGAEGLPEIPKLPPKLPKKYTEPKTSDISAEVKSGTLNEYQFQLLSK